MYTCLVLYIRSTFLSLIPGKSWQLEYSWNTLEFPDADFDFNFLCSITRGPVERENSVGVRAGELPFPSASQWEDGENVELGPNQDNQVMVSHGHAVCEEVMQ